MFAAATTFAQDGSDAREIIKKHLKKLGRDKFEETPKGNYKFIFDIDKKPGERVQRSQLVFIGGRTAKWGDLEFIRIWSTAEKPERKLTAERANDLLLRNSVEKFGRWELHESSKGYRVVYSIRVSVKDSADALEKALMTVCIRADSAEKSFTGKDDF